MTEDNKLEACAYLRVKKLDSRACMPVRNTNTDAGIDLFSLDEVVIAPKERNKIHTGIALEIPEGFYGRVAPRSGLAAKNGIDVLAGVVDSGYRGEIIVILYNTSDEEFTLPPQSKIAQLIVEAHFNFPILEVEELTGTERGENGFGSSDIK